MRGDRPFSEYTFAFAATHELMRISPWWARTAPIIPSLRAEGRLGYDVRFELPGSFVFVQFKLGQLRSQLRLVGDELNSSVHKLSLRGLSHAGIWQFWTSHAQHRLLTRLSSRFPAVYYIAPRFRTQSELHELFRRKRIIASSIIARAGDFPVERTDNGHRHRVISPVSAPTEIFVCSEIIRTKNINWLNEITEQARAWPDSAPLAIQIDQLWKELPGAARAKHAALTRTIRILSDPANTSTFTVTSLIPSILEGVSPAQRIGSVSRRRLPPWEKAISSYPTEDQSGGNIQLQAKLSIIADRLSAYGIETVVMQPSNESLR